MSDIEKMLTIDKEMRPELWERTEQVARIIDPGAFVDGWVITPDESKTLFETRKKYMQAVAMNKAQVVLRYLGVNTDVDWLALLSRMAEGHKPQAETHTEGEDATPIG